MDLIIRKTQSGDLTGIKALYLAVAVNQRGIARNINEINDDYVQNIWAGISNNGLGFVALHGGQIVGEIHASQKGIAIFNHLLSYLTIGIHPDFQSQGLGKQLFEAFLNYVKSHRTDIYRVELESRASNLRGIKLYERMGFVQEGKMINQTRNPDGSHEDGVAYAWFNPFYEGVASEVA